MENISLSSDHLTYSLENHKANFSVFSHAMQTGTKLNIQGVVFTYLGHQRFILWTEMYI